MPNKARNAKSVTYSVRVPFDLDELVQQMLNAETPSASDVMRAGIEALWRERNGG